MFKLYLYVLIILLTFINTAFSYSARDEIEKYGFAALGDDISGIHYNPATIFNLLPFLSEFNLTTDHEFSYNSFYIGSYITKFHFLSSKYSTSINLGLGIENNDNNKNLLISEGGTLINFVKYGMTYKYIDSQSKKYSDADFGLLFRFSNWMNFGVSILNIENQIQSPFQFISGLLLALNENIHLTGGFTYNNKFQKIEDYSGALEVNLINNLYISGGLQKNQDCFGIGNNFNNNTENIYCSSEYNRLTKKFNNFILSYDHKFLNILNKKPLSQNPQFINKKEQNKDTLLNQQTLDLQKEMMIKAETYYSEERFDDARDVCQKIIQMNNKSSYADEAKQLLEKINKILN